MSATDTFIVTKAFPGHALGAEVQFDPAAAAQSVADGFLVKKDAQGVAEVNDELAAATDAMAERVWGLVSQKINARTKSAPFNLSAGNGDGNTVDGLNNAAEPKEEGSLAELLQAIGWVGSQDYPVERAKGTDLLTNKYKLDTGGPVSRSHSFDSMFKSATAMNGAQFKGVMQESQGTAGGFAVAPQFAETFFELLYPKSILLSEVTRRVVTALDYYEPTWDYSLGGPTAGPGGTPADPYLAGLTGQWVPEGAMMSLTTATIKQIHLKMNTFGGLLQITRQLLQDGPRLQAMLMDKFAQIAAYFLTAAIFNGGGGSPIKGFINAPSALPVNRTSSAAGTLLTDLATMFAKRLSDDGAASRAFWMVSPSAEKALILLNDTTGRLVFLPNFPGPAGGSVTNRVPMTLFGLPVVRNQYCSQFGTAKDIVLVDPASILLGVRQDLEIAASEHYAFGSNIMTYRFLMRADSQSAVNMYLTLPNGDQVAPYVYLN